MTGIRYDVSRGFARITLDRPQARNCFDLEMSRDLADAVAAACGDAAARAILVDAVGPMFSGGGDLHAFAALGPTVGSTLRAMARHAHAALAMLATAPKPVVCSVQGPAAGLGMALALVGDQVVAGRSASFATGYTAIGFTPDGGLSHMLVRLAGLRRAQELIFAGRRLDAVEACEWGIVGSVVEDEELRAAADRTAATMAAGPTAAFAACKRLLNASGSYFDALAAEAEAIATAASASDGLEGLKAFAERRRPAFGGA